MVTRTMPVRTRFGSEPVNLIIFVVDGFCLTPGGAYG